MKEGNNVFSSINSFHDVCVAIWETGEREEQWHTWFNKCDEEYNSDWAKMHMEMMNEDYIAYTIKHGEVIEITDTQFC